MARYSKCSKGDVMWCNRFSIVIYGTCLALYCAERYYKVKLVFSAVL